MSESYSDDPEILSDVIWQDKTRPSIENIKESLEKRAKTNESMEDFSLSKEDLRGIDLVNRGSKKGYTLINSDLYQAKLENAHLFKIDLSGTSLMKANLSNANLNYANLERCNLLGVNLKDAKTEHCNWGERLLQQELALHTTDREEQIDLYQQAEEIYRNLRQVAENQGLVDVASEFYLKEMLMRRNEMPKYSLRRIISKSIDLFCGYGERPLRVIIFSLALIIGFSMAYFFLGLSFNGEVVVFSFKHNFLSNVEVFFNSLYFSVVTFTTLGYGDLTPIGLAARAIAALEAFMGSFTIALFVVVFVKKVTR